MTQGHAPFRVNRKAEEWIKAQLREGDGTPEVLRLTRLGILSHEFAFHFGDLNKATFLEVLELAWHFPVPLTIEGDADDFFERSRSRTSPEVLMVAECAVLLGECRREGVPFDRLMKFVADSWDSGIHYCQVTRGEAEGGITDPWQIAYNFACGLCLPGISGDLFPGNKPRNMIETT